VAQPLLGGFYEVDKKRAQPCPYVSFSVTLANHMHDEPLHNQKKKPTSGYAYVAVLFLIVVLGAYLRFSTLGGRSLWADEFATWHVSRMPLGESLRWQPELTKPPLYQLCLRLITHEAHPSEWLLRLPAALAGVLTIPAAYLLACMMTCRRTALSLAALLAVNLTQIDYSQEARPYSMLVLGAILSMWAFLKLCQQPDWQRGALYAVISALTFHTHYLGVFVIVAHAAWWIVVNLARRQVIKPVIFIFSWSLLGLLCAPILIHCLRTKTSTTQGLGWIEPITWSASIGVLTSITSEAAWIWLVLTPTILLYMVKHCKHLFSKNHQAHTTTTERLPTSQDSISPAAHFLVSNETTTADGILISWFAFSFLGLVAISLLGQPSMLVRYALPATVPVLLWPLTIVRRWHRNAPVVVTLIFVVGTAPDWITHSWHVEPGFRELAAFVQNHVDPVADRVALVIDNTTFPDWEDVERLPLAYYPITGHRVREIELNPDGRPKRDNLFQETSPIYLIVFRSNPLTIAQNVGATIAPINVGGASYNQLLFSPYRLAKLLPKNDT